MALIADIAQAVVDAINAADWSQDLEAERSYADWDDELSERDTLRIDVVPVDSPTVDLQTRGSIRWSVGVDIAVRKRFGTDARTPDKGRLANAKIDALIGLVEEFAAYFVTDRFASLEASSVAWQSTTIPALYISEHLRQYGQFTGLIRLGFHADAAL